MQQQITHPQSGVLIAGMLLVGGAILQKGDLYNSTTGVWEQCQCTGLTLSRGTQTIWVRPMELSEHAQNLIAQLSYYESGLFSHIKKLPGSLYMVIVPTPDFNWDTRVGTPIVEHRECLQELIDCGYLSFDKWTEAYSLTEAGRKGGLKK